MTTANRPARLNRTLLALTGLVLLAAGGFALATRFEWLRVVDRDGPLIPTPGSPPTWAFYAAAAAAILLGLLCVRWLAAQAFRRPKSGTWRLDSDADVGTTRIDTPIAVRPLTAEVGGYPGVSSVSATLSGPREAAVLHLWVVADSGADLGEIRERVEEYGLPRFRQSLDLEFVTVKIEFRFTAKTGTRAR
jgi:hypothetical protein